MRLACAAVLAACLTGQAAFAHAVLERAIPAVGAELAAPPTAVTLVFSEAIEVAFSSVAVTDADGRRVDQQTLRTENDGTVLVAPLPTLPPGVYEVAWRVTSVDTHRTQGHFRFTIGR